MTTPTFIFQVLEFDYRIDMAILSTWGADGWQMVGFQLTQVLTSQYSNDTHTRWTCMMQKQFNE